MVVGLVGLVVWEGESLICGVPRALCFWLVFPAERCCLTRRRTLEWYRLSRSCPGLGRVFRSGLLAPVLRCGLLAPNWCDLSYCSGCPVGFLQVSGSCLCQNRLNLCLLCRDPLGCFGWLLVVPPLCLGPPRLCSARRWGR